MKNFDLNSSCFGVGADVFKANGNVSGDERNLVGSLYSGMENGLISCMGVNKPQAFLRIFLYLKVLN